MRYRNSTPPALETPKDETREFAILLSAVAAILAVLVVTAMGLAGWVAPMIPFPLERSLASATVQPMVQGHSSASAEERAIQKELDSLVQRIAEVMNLPGDMAITVHYVNTPTVNAMATLGGNLFVFRGLLAKLSSEDALASVLAHEIAHVRERHVIRAMGRGVAIVALLSGLGINNRGLSQWALGHAGDLTTLSYSRDAERDADRAALDAVHRLYGNVGGMMELFDLFANHSSGGLEIMKTHPLPERRAAELRRLAAAKGYPIDGPRVPLKPALAALATASPQTP